MPHRLGDCYEYPWKRQIPKEHLIHSVGTPLLGGGGRVGGGSLKVFFYKAITKRFNPPSITKCANIPVLPCVCTMKRVLYSVRFCRDIGGQSVKILTTRCAVHCSQSYAFNLKLKTMERTLKTNIYNLLYSWTPGWTMTPLCLAYTADYYSTLSCLLWRHADSAESCLLWRQTQRCPANSRVRICGVLPTMETDSAVSCPL